MRGGFHPVAGSRPAKSQPIADADTFDADAFGHHADTNSDPQPDCDADSNRNADSNGDPNPNCLADSGRVVNFTRDANSKSDAISNPAALTALPEDIENQRILSAKSTAAIQADLTRPRPLF